MKSLIIGSFLFTLSFAHAYECDVQGLRTVSVSVDHESKTSSRFNYRYQVVGNLDPASPVIVYIPGGPGGSAINDFTKPGVLNRNLSRGLPADIPLVNIDPRTVGCNQGDEGIFPDRTLTSEQHANDILSVIEDLKLQKYILYGHSYGSQAATFVAAQAAKRKLPAPHAIVLSGVLGKGEGDGSLSIPVQVQLEWELLKMQLPVSTVELISQDNPLGLEDGNLGWFINQGLSSGVAFSRSKGRLTHALLDDLLTLKADDPETHKALAEKIMAPRQGTGGIGDYSDRLFAKINCHEFSPADGGTMFINGKFVMDTDPCEGEAFDRRYDSAELQVNAPLYYFIGDHDPRAPYVSAVHHVNNQTESRRNVVVIPGGGHNHLGHVLPLCAHKIWDSVLERKDLSSVIPDAKRM